MKTISGHVWGQARKVSMCQFSGKVMRTKKDSLSTGALLLNTNLGLTGCVRGYNAVLI